MLSTEKEHDNDVPKKRWKEKKNKKNEDKDDLEKRWKKKKNKNMRTKMYLERAQLPHRGEPKAENLDQLSRLRSPREPRPLAWYFYLDFFLFCSSSTNTAKVTINRLDSEQLLFFREAFPWIQSL